MRGPRELPGLVSRGAWVVPPVWRGAARRVRRENRGRRGRAATSRHFGMTAQAEEKAILTRRALILSSALASAA